LLARDDMVVNIDNHNEILSMCLASYLSKIHKTEQAARDWSIGVLIEIRTRLLQHFITPSLHYVFVGGRNIKLRTADVNKAQPKMAKERP
jgi:hypothetical protein